jgi:hypothetical protein
MRRTIFGVGLAMLLLPLAAWGQSAPVAAPAVPAAVCAQTAAAPSLDLILGQGNLTTASATPFMPVTCTCTSERAACVSDCQSQGCRASFVCYTPDPCSSSCTCNRCLP